MNCQMYDDKRTVSCVCRIVNNIKNTNSRIEKEAMLMDARGNFAFQTFLLFAYNPYIVTGISKKKFEKKCINIQNSKIGDFFDLLDYLKINNTGTDAVVATVQEYASRFEGDEYNFIKSVVCKDFPIGISSVTINKIYGENYIPKFGVQLAVGLNDKTMPTEAFALTQKLDGNRCVVFNYPTGPIFYARSGKEIEGLKELEEQFRRMPVGQVYDGELIAVNYDSLESKDLFNLTQTLVRKKGGKENLEFVMFDTLPIEEFAKGQSKKPYGARWEDMNIMLIHSKLDNEPGSRIRIVPRFYIGNDVSKIPYWLERATKAGCEGVMVNLLDAPYLTKRTSNLIKVKKFNTVDLRITHCLPHSRDENILGSLVVDYKGYRVSVGSGFSDTQRKQFWEKRDELIGKIAEVQYFEETQNQMGGYSLRFPVFIMLRDDKDEPSYN